MRLKELRKEKKLKQIEIAEVLNCSQGVYSRYESEEREPPFDIIKKLADFYGVTVDYLMGRDVPLSTTENKETATSSEDSDGESIIYMMPRSANGRNMYSQLSPEDRAIIDSMVRTLFEKTFGGK
jgi:transcriptional regulator with XRE-family HTH domain